MPLHLLTCLFHGIFADVSPGNVARKEPRLGLGHTPPVAQTFQQLGGKHDIPVFLALALFHADDHSLAIDIWWPQVYNLRDAQASCVAGC